MKNNAVVSNPGSASASAFTASVITLLMVEGRGCPRFPGCRSQPRQTVTLTLDIFYSFPVVYAHNGLPVVKSREVRMKMLSKNDMQKCGRGLRQMS